MVDNWCSSPSDPGSSAADCGFDTEIENEDDFFGEVRFGGALVSNPLPAVTLTGPATGTAGDTLTFTANATDDEPIENYAFDFNNDGRFEADNLRSNVAGHRFESAGYYNVGVRVRDQDGDTAFASLKVVVSGPASSIVSARGLLSSFRLNRPVFGGRKRNRLVVRYRLREAGRAIVSLYRGKTRVKRLSSGNRRANRTYRINIRPEASCARARPTRSGSTCAAPTASARSRRACRPSACRRTLGTAARPVGCAAGWPSCATTSRIASRPSRSTSPRRATRSPTS